MFIIVDLKMIGLRNINFNANLNLKVNAMILLLLFREAFNISVNIVVSSLMSFTDIYVTVANLF